jgi:nitronate monooxygenase
MTRSPHWLTSQRLLFQAPIGSIASPDLAVAVCNAGGIGQIAGTWRSTEQLRIAIRTIRERTTAPFGVNFVLGFPFEDQLAVALAEGVSIISFFWGDASRYVEQVKAAGAVAIQVVGSTEEAQIAEAAGFDLVVAQGYEAGGHIRGQLGTFVLVPLVRDAVGIPVIAAGGIADRRGVAAALALGATGVWVGTPFLLAQEANIHSTYREKVRTASAEDAIYSSVFEIGWPAAPHRSLKNSTIERWQQHGRPLIAARSGAGDVVARRADGSPIPRYHFAAPTRDMTGNIEAMALYAGQSVGLVLYECPAAEIVTELLAGFDRR